MEKIIVQSLVKIVSIIAEILLTLSFLWLAVVGDGGVHSHFHVKLNLGYVCLSCG